MADQGYMYYLIEKRYPGFYSNEEPKEATPEKKVGLPVHQMPAAAQNFGLPNLFANDQREYLRPNRYALNYKSLSPQFLANQDLLAKSRKYSRFNASDSFSLSSQDHQYVCSRWPKNIALTPSSSELQSKQPNNIVGENLEIVVGSTTFASAESVTAPVVANSDVKTSSLSELPTLVYKPQEDYKRVA